MTRRAPQRPAADAFSYLELDAAAEDLGVHDRIPGKSVDRMLERRGPILLEEEMTDPGEAVAGDRQQPPPSPAPAPDHRAEQDQNERAADEMQAPARRVAVLRQVERIELAET